MRVRILAALSAVLLATALAPAPAGAITNGKPDAMEHPNVGALLVAVPGGWVIGCSGTLIGPTVFLTAGHCVALASYYYPEATGYAVSFDSDLDLDADGFVDPDTLIHVTSRDFMPSYAFTSNQTRDVGVVHLATEPDGVEPEPLPPLGAAAKAVGHEAVTVGYGWNTLDRSWRSQNSTFTSDGVRTRGTSRVRSVSPNSLTTHAAPSTACYHDSGGPLFVNGDLVSISVTGDVPCVTLQRSQRLDLPDVQQWLTDVLEDH
jgi:hypothetical protein